MFTYYAPLQYYMSPFQLFMQYSTAVVRGTQLMSFQASLFFSLPPSNRVDFCLNNPFLYSDSWLAFQKRLTGSQPAKEGKESLSSSSSSFFLSCALVPRIPLFLIPTKKEGRQDESQKWMRNRKKRERKRRRRDE